MSITRFSDQENLLDGTVIMYDPVPKEGVYATILGRNGQVFVIAFDFKDLATLHKAAESAFDGDLRSTAEDRSRVTERGLEYLKTILPESPEGEA